MSRRHHIVGTRDWEREIYEHLAAHGRTEGEILEEYQHLVDDEDAAPALRYLARMIVDDEVRHHRIFDELAETFREIVDGDDADPPIPSLQGMHTDRIRIRRITDALLETERRDEHELTELAKRLAEFDVVTMWGLLIELMLDDTRKHITILRFLQERADDQPD